MLGGLASYEGDGAVEEAFYVFVLALVDAVEPLGHGDLEAAALDRAEHHFLGFRMQHFDGEIEKLVRVGLVDMDTGLAYATNPGNLRLILADFATFTPAG